MHIAVVGLSHRTAPVEVREKLSIPEELIEKSFKSLRKYPRYIWLIPKLCLDDAQNIANSYLKQVQIV